MPKADADFNIKEDIVLWEIVQIKTYETVLICFFFIPHFIMSCIRPIAPAPIISPAYMIGRKFLEANIITKLRAPSLRTIGLKVIFRMV